MQYFCRSLIFPSKFNISILTHHIRSTKQICPHLIYNLFVKTTSAFLTQHLDFTQYMHPNSL